MNKGIYSSNRLIAYLHERHPEIPVFADCKIGDIDNTMLAYMDRLFVEAGVDGVVINPYMGDDVFAPFLQDPKKVANEITKGLLFVI